MTTSRRRFLGLVGTGIGASAGVSGAVAAGDTPVVEMQNNYFDPIGLHVETGTAVRFVLEAGAHSATAYPDRIPADAPAFDSGTIAQGEFEHTFDAPGTYDYYCIPHKGIGMVGRVVVGSAGGPAEDGAIPDGSVPNSASIVEQGAVSYEAFTEDGGDTGGGMMGGGMGSGMMGRGGSGWVGILPLAAGALGMLGVVGGVLYWAAGRGGTRSASDDGAMETLRERYARGELDEEEYRRRRDRLESDE